MFMHLPRYNRQCKLFLRFHFICNCIACVNDYPLYLKLPRPNNVPSIGRIVMSSPLIHDDEYARHAIDVLKDFLDKYDGVMIQQVVHARGVFNMCLETLLKNLPLAILNKNKF